MTHLHVLVGWRSSERWEDVPGKIKNIISLELSKRFNSKGRPWFVDQASRRRVTKQDHFDYLIETYIFDHSGWRWDERRGWTAPSRPQTSEHPR